MDLSSSIDNTGDKPERLLENGSEYLEYLENNQRDIMGISTGFKYYDAAIGGGLRRGSVNIIGARPKNSKSTLAKEIGIYISHVLKIPVLYLDTEMNKEDQIHRSLASLSNVPIEHIETGKFGQIACTR